MTIPWKSETNYRMIICIPKTKFNADSSPSTTYRDTRRSTSPTFAFFTASISQYYSVIFVNCNEINLYGIKSEAHRNNLKIVLESL